MHHVNQVFAVVMFGLSLWLLDRIFHGPWLLALWGVWCLFVAWCMHTFSLRAGWSGRVGMIFVFFAALLFWGSFRGEGDPMKVLSYNPWENKVANASALVFENVDSIHSLQTAQDNAEKQALPMMLVFYADWCISCKHLEHDVFADPRISQQLKDWELVRADVTPYSEANQLLLKKFDLIGPPAVLFFDKKGRELTEYRIIGESSTKQFQAQMDRLKPALSGS
jgi:thiol:disulfide interchange protein DsbD